MIATGLRSSVWVSSPYHSPSFFLTTDFTGDTLLRKLEVAVVESRNQAAEHARYEQVLPVQHLNEWRDMVERWEKDKGAPNPFAATSKGKSYF
jgi:hypothetical protein